MTQNDFFRFASIRDGTNKTTACTHSGGARKRAQNIEGTGKGVASEWVEAPENRALGGENLEVIRVWTKSSVGLRLNTQVRRPFLDPGIQDPSSHREREPRRGIPDREKKQDLKREKVCSEKGGRRPFIRLRRRREESWGGRKEDETRRVGSQRGGRFNRSHRGNKGEEVEECSGMRRVSARRPMIKTQTWKKRECSQGAIVAFEWELFSSELFRC